MWMPKSESEILTAIADHKLRETAIFEAKRQLPEKQKNYDIAIDIAAMTTDGGVIIYGLEQDRDGWIINNSPFSITNTPERITAIAESSISEPPVFFIHVIPTDADPSLGYIVVQVPPSPRAPHMVIVNGQFRFYGRSDTGNRALLEGEVARLYERRKRLESDFDVQLLNDVNNASVPPSLDHGNLHLIAQPLFDDKNMLDRAAKGSDSLREFMNEAVIRASALRLKEYAIPNFQKPRNWERNFDGYHCFVSGSDRHLRERLELKFDHSGTLRLFCCAAVWAFPTGGKFINSILVAELALRFLFMAGIFYSSAGYLGMVNIGLALTGIRLTSLSVYGDGLHGDPVVCKDDSYLRTSQVAAPTLHNSYREVAEDVLMPLFATLSREHYDPFKVLFP